MKKLLQKTCKSFIHLAFFVVLFYAFSFNANSQQTNDKAKIVDKTVATVSDGVRTELITYSDLLWWLALKPGVPIDPPSSDNLNRVLQELINFRIFALESERLPSAPPTDDEINEEIQRNLKLFCPPDEPNGCPSPEFRRRLNAVGFNSVSDENFVELMRKRVAIKKYIGFRFRSFVVITPEDEKRYYENTYKRRKDTGENIKEFEDVQIEINEILTEQKVASDMEKFLDNAESRAEIIILSEV